jgi:hypothetical protein
LAAAAAAAYLAPLRGEAHLQLLPVCCHVVALLGVGGDGIPKGIITVAVVSQQLSTYASNISSTSRACDTTATTATTAAEQQN